VNVLQEKFINSNSSYMAPQAAICKRSKEGSNFYKHKWLHFRFAQSWKEKRRDNRCIIDCPWPLVSP